MTQKTVSPLCWGILLGTLGLGLTLSILGCGDLTCEVPEGTYKLKVVKSVGDCPESIKNGIAAAINNDTVTVKSPENGCGDVTARAVSSDETTQCEIMATGTADGNEDGISNFDMTIEVRGAGCQIQCSQRMSIEAKR